MEHLFYIVWFVIGLSLIIKESFKYLEKLEIKNSNKTIEYDKPIKQKRKTSLKKSSEYVYFIYSAEVKRIKIGLTVNEPNERMRKLQTGSPTILYMLAYQETDDCRSLEKELHNLFKRFRSHTNNEFFELDNSIVEYINQNCNFKQLDILKYER